MNREVVCCCHNVTLKDMKEQIKLGVYSFEELQAITKIGTDCLPCKEKNEKLFKLLLEKKTLI